MSVVDGSGTTVGSATVLGAAALFAVLSGTVAGQASVEGDMNPQGAGYAQGVSTPSGAAVSAYYVNSDISGAASTTSAAGVLRLASGYTNGEGTLDWNYFVNGSGTSVGQASVTGSGIRVIVARSSWIFGSGSLIWSGAPLPIFGIATVVGAPVVDRHLPAVRAIVAPSKGFRYLQLLQRGDLPIYLCNNAGPVSPVWVGFTMYQVLPCGARKRIGPAQRTPAKGLVGEFYATGRAGESGQPGNWVIVWEWRHYFEGAVQSEEMEFQVLDAVAAADSRDITIRCRKYGWN
jgi:hypothetical protein